MTHGSPVRRSADAIATPFHAARERRSCLGRDALTSIGIIRIVQQGRTEAVHRCTSAIRVSGFSVPLRWKPPPCTQTRQRNRTAAARGGRIRHLAMSEGCHLISGLIRRYAGQPAGGSSLSCVDRRRGLRAGRGCWASPVTGARQWHTPDTRQLILAMGLHWVGVS
ncbi:hypothetical protein L1887_62665 [Cichorium endivia]|nr:hypothetical protein L1887_62665 [Cichorium endivia]